MMARAYVITGAGSRIGKTTAQILTTRGIRVIDVDLKSAEVSGETSRPQKDAKPRPRKPPAQPEAPSTL